MVTIRNRTGISHCLAAVFVCSAFLLSIPGSVSAQVSPGPHTGAPVNGRAMDKEIQHAQQLAAELGLNQSQTTQILAIIKETRTREKAVKTDSTLMPAQQQARIKEIRKNKRIQIATVLTPAQRAHLKQIERGGV